MTRSVLEVTPHLLTLNSSNLDEPDIASISSDPCNGDQESANEENRFEVISIHSSESSTKRKEEHKMLL